MSGFVLSAVAIPLTATRVRSAGCALLLFCFWVVATPAQATLTDRLERPALLSSLAQRSLLLDLAATDGLLVAVGERGHILRSDDGGHRWQQVPVPTSVTLTSVYLVDAQYGWAAGHDGVLLATRDGGRNWVLQLDGRRLNERVVAHYQALMEQLDAGARDDLDPDALALALDDALFARDDGPTKPFLDLYFADRRRGWAVGAYGLFLTTEDGGESWQPAMLQLDNPDNFHLNAIAAQDGQLMIAGEAGALFRADVAGSAWERLDAGYEGPLFSVTPLGEQRWLLSGLRGRLFFSEDDGESWEAHETATRATLNAALALADGRVVAVGNGGAVLQQAAGAADFSVRMQPGRVSYTALAEVAPGELVLVGQKGVRRASLRGLMEAQDD